MGIYSLYGNMKSLIVVTGFTCKAVVLSWMGGDLVKAVETKASFVIATEPEDPNAKFCAGHVS